MYRDGELQIAPTGCQLDEDGDCNVPSHEFDHPTDMRDDSPGWHRLFGGVFLPHSCDSWVIGGPVQIRALIADLQAALSKLEGGGAPCHASSPPA